MKPFAAKTRRLHWLLPAAGLVLWLSACAGGYGGLNKTPDVTQMFVESRLPEDHSYYFIGRETMPYAVIGIKDGYQLQSRFWKPVDPDTDRFRKMVRSPYGHQSYPPMGAYMVGPEGNRVGLWYSTYDFASFRVTEDKTVYVYNPYDPTGLERSSLP